MVAEEVVLPNVGGTFMTPESIVFHHATTPKCLFSKLLGYPSLIQERKKKGKTKENLLLPTIQMSIVLTCLNTA